MDTIPALIALLYADEDIRFVVGDRISQNQSPAEAPTDETGAESGGTKPFITLTRRDATSEDVLSPADVSELPDYEAIDLDAAARDPVAPEKIGARVRALLHGKTPTLGSRTPQFVEVTDQDEGYSGREDLIEQGLDVVNLRIGIYY